jgi:hypothetical protein
LEFFTTESTPPNYNKRNLHTNNQAKRCNIGNFGTVGICYLKEGPNQQYQGNNFDEYFVRLVNAIGQKYKNI